MLLETLTRPDVLEALKNAPESADAGEDRLVLSGITWEQYLEIDEALGHDRSTPRMYFHEGELEIITTSFRHEKTEKWIGILLEDYFYETAIEVSPHGQTTIKILKKAGAEPDESWCFGEDKEFPDLVLEVALTSGGINKLKIYQQFGVSEVWFWRNDTIEIWTLRANASGYDGPSTRSRLLPKLDLKLLLNCLKISPWRKARQTFREQMSKG